LLNLHSALLEGNFSVISARAGRVSEANVVDGLGDTEQCEHLSLEIGKFRLEGMNGFSFVLKKVSLQEAEQAEDLFGGGALGCAFFSGCSTRGDLLN
jgi:hypothetical protein